MIQLGDCKIKKNVFYVTIPVLKPFPADCFNYDLHEKILDEFQNLEGSYFVEGVTIEYKLRPDVENFSHIR